MKSNKEVCLRLEALEDRIAPNGAFGGAINAGPPPLAPFPFNGLVAVQTAAFVQSQPGFRNVFTDFSPLSFHPAPSLQSQLQSFQNQLQAFQAAQTAAIDQFFSQLGTIVQELNIHTIVVI